jgi:hypothetical protein
MATVVDDDDGRFGRAVASAVGLVDADGRVRLIRLIVVIDGCCWATPGAVVDGCSGCG